MQNGIKFRMGTLLILMSLTCILTAFRTFLGDLILDHFWMMTFCLGGGAFLFAIVEKKNAKTSLRVRFASGIGITLVSLLLVVLLMILRFRWCAISIDACYPRGFPYPDRLLNSIYEILPTDTSSPAGSINFEGNYNEMLLFLSISLLLATSISGYLIGRFVSR